MAWIKSAHWICGRRWEVFPCEKLALSHHPDALARYTSDLLADPENLSRHTRRLSGIPESLTTDTDDLTFDPETLFFDPKALTGDTGMLSGDPISPVFNPNPMISSHLQ